MNDMTTDYKNCEDLAVLKRIIWLAPIRRTYHIGKFSVANTFEDRSSNMMSRSMDDPGYVYALNVA
jgi:hypothetical protein